MVFYVPVSTMWLGKYYPVGSQEVPLELAIALGYEAPVLPSAIPEDTSVIILEDEQKTLKSKLTAK